MEEMDDVIKEFHPHPINFMGFYIVAILLILLGFSFFKLLIIVGILAFGFGEMSRRADTFYLLNGGVERGHKLFSTSKKFIAYDKIQGIEVDQSFIETIFKIGTLKFDTSGTDAIELIFYGVKDPYGIEKIIRGKMAIK